MHTPVCKDAREFWPESAPTEIDVSALPAAGAITNPRRIPGCGPWLGFWGPSFAGLRVGFEPTKSFPVINGLAVPYPIDPNDEGGVDLYLSRDTGGAGTLNVARFKTKEAAEAWGGRPTPGTGSSSGSAALPNRSTPVRATVAGGQIGASWTQAGFLYATIKADKDNAAAILLGSGGVGAGIFPLEPGESISGYVETATGWTGSGTNGDAADVIEFGRV